MAIPPVPFPVLAPPPLPPGWTEHKAPGGQSSYYNAATKQSTYTRPISAFPVPPSHATETAAPPAKKKKKEKPLVKTPIPDTDWLRVKTTEGNIFYTHKEKKESVWTVPDEIKEAVEKLEQEERDNEEKERQLEAARIAAERQREIEAEQEREAKQREEEQARQRAEMEAEVERVKKEAKEASKRKAEAEAQAESQHPSKKPRVEGEDGEDDESGHAAAKSSAKSSAPPIPDISIEEAKALFKAMLIEKDLNPLLPWDQALPELVSHPNYALLHSVTARREVFDEYCREKSRAIRAAKASEKTSDPKEEFERLLRKEVTSTRQPWDDFRRKWKKDRRFYGWGRDDKQRETRFREWLKELGEQKRADAKKAEANFFVLLKSCKTITPDSNWKDVKKKLVDDPRYDAVGSSSLREELFQTYIKTLSTSNSTAADEETKKAEEEQRRKEKRERAVKEREAAVNAQKGKLESDLAQSRLGLSREEGERDFRSLLTDAVREPLATWDSSLPSLERDPRYINSPLPVNHRRHLFQTHVASLRDKQLGALRTLFASHAPGLATSFDSLPLSSLLASLPATKLGLNQDRLEDEYSRWQRERAATARVEFDQMLGENAFVEFWGRMRKMESEKVGGGLTFEEEEGDEGEGGGGKIDMKALAKGIDIEEMQRVLKHDKRFTIFDHMPEQRLKWVQEYVSRLSAPKLSVHVPEHS